MFRLHSPELSSTVTLFDDKINQMHQTLKTSFEDVQKTILNESSVCFQMDLSLNRTDLSSVWQHCNDLAEHLNFRCFLSLTRSRPSSIPKLQVIIDTEDRQRENEKSDIDDDCSVESILGVGEHYLFNIPGSTMIKCTLPLDEDGILDLGKILDDASYIWGRRYRNVSLFGNIEDKEGVQTIYITVANKEDNDTLENDQTETHQVTTVNEPDYLPIQSRAMNEKNVISTRSQGSMASFPSPDKHRASFIHRLKETAINGSILAFFTGIAVPVIHGYLNSYTNGKT